MVNAMANPATAHATTASYLQLTSGWHGLTWQLVGSSVQF
jgi:hypothetical protein